MARHHRIRIAGAEVIEIELGIVSAGHPRHAAAVFHSFRIWPGLGARLAFARRGVPAPLQLAGLRIARFQIAGHIERIAAHPHDDVIANDDGRGRGEILLFHVGNFNVPAFGAVLGVERNEVIVGGFEVEPASIHAEAAASDVDAAVRFPLVMPDLAAGARVDGPGVVGEREIEDAVDFERRRFDGRRKRSGAGIEAIFPGQGHRGDVRRIDVRERTEAAAGVIAVVSGPRIGGRLEQQCWIQTLCRQPGANERERERSELKSHFKVSR